MWFEEEGEKPGKNRGEEERKTTKRY